LQPPAASVSLPRRSFNTATMVAANLALLLNAAIWGTMIPVLVLLLDTWDPFFLAASRYALGVPVILLLVLLVERGGLGRGGVPRWRLWLLGAVGMGGFAPLYTIGIANSHPVVAAVVGAIGPVTAAVIAWAMYRVPFDRGTTPGIALAVAGAVLATYAPAEDAPALTLRGGELLIVAAQACWAWYSLAAQRWLAGWSQLRISALTMTTGGATLILVYLVAVAAGAAYAPPAVPRSGEDIGLFVWMVLASVVLGLLLWNFGVRRVGVVVASLFMNLVPIVAIAITAALGTRPTTLQLVGGALVIAGVMQTQLRRATRP
jgi:drug/metabolite transporter (DMT)-like permease